MSKNKARFYAGSGVSQTPNYIKVYEVLKSIGKITVVVGVKGQNINSVRPVVDSTLVLNEDFFEKCKRETSSKHFK